ncbi:hypothetical protein EYM_03390 [Ignicoccus islandicus DSM 13165]|uniref:Prefoldin subunit alpha n=1 Tax=Ignicoccus islandicus DSM 13165 TaxID=940295 RepID=A0A0U2VEG8_9CREN|nr:prefoldin subunit alpha [Ignicoccus islandicus]ALU12402.1 hypothetical protein EYM_03390 [Ignicoccus islandicus DSM 13165]
MSSNEQAEIYALVYEYQNLKKLAEILGSEIEKKRIDLSEVNVALDEINNLRESVEALVPLGPVFVKGTLTNKVIVPIGSNYFVAMKPDEAKQKLNEIKAVLEKQIKELEGKLNEVLTKISSIESQLLKLQGSSSARETQEGSKESSKGS